MRFLKIVNSSYYGLSREITDLNQAVSILGILAIRNIAITLSLFDVFPIHHSPEYTNLFRQSLTTAVAAEFISHITSKKTQSDVFLSALLINIGAFILMRYLPERYSFLLKSAHKYGIEETAIEDMVLHTNRVQVGFTVAKRWKLPSIIRTAIAHGYDVKNVDQEDLPDDTKFMLKTIYLGRIVGDIYWTGNKTYNISLFKQEMFNLLSRKEDIALDVLSSIPQLIEDLGLLDLQANENIFPTFNEILQQADEELRENHIHSKRLYAEIMKTKGQLSTVKKKNKQLETELKKSNLLVQKLALHLKK